MPIEHKLPKDAKSWAWLIGYAFDMAKEIAVARSVPPGQLFSGGAYKGGDVTPAKELMVMRLRNEVVQFTGCGTVYFARPNSEVLSGSLRGFKTTSQALSHPYIAEILGFRNHTAVTSILRKNGMGVKNKPIDEKTLDNIRASKHIENEQERND